MKQKRSPACQDLSNLHIQQNQLRLSAQLVRTDKSVMRAAQVKLKGPTWPQRTNTAACFTFQAQ
jgi:hypothetical protein